VGSITIANHTKLITVDRRKNILRNLRLALSLNIFLNDEGFINATIKAKKETNSNKRNKLSIA
jgi:hypothetical protein